jgi:hypothetical protein
MIARLRPEALHRVDDDDGRVEGAHGARDCAELSADSGTVEVGHAPAIELVGQRLRHPSPVWRPGAVAVANRQGNAAHVGGAGYRRCERCLSMPRMA